MGRQKLPFAEQSFRNMYVSHLDSAKKATFTQPSGTVKVCESLTIRKKYRDPGKYFGAPLLARKPDEAPARRKCSYGKHAGNPAERR